MKHIYPIVFLLLTYTQVCFSQNPGDCNGFMATYSTMESRCASTGSIQISASGGSGNYNYKILEPVAGPLTSTSTLSGLAPGTYTVYVKDMTTGCTIVKNNLVVTGSYSDPRFQLINTDVSCTGGSDGAISVTNQQFGRNPLSYTVVSPSPASVGVTNTTGSFTGLVSGQYFIQLRDSCGGIQTRSVTIQDYSWSITNSTISKLNCTTISAAIQLTDNKGNTNASGTAFNGFNYGVVNTVGDTSWHTTSTFNYVRTLLRTLTFVVKDRCGNVKSFNWTNSVPQLSAGVTTSGLACNTFNVAVISPANLTSPQYSLKSGAVTVQTNTTGSFTNVAYGTYCIEMRDACYDTTISRCFTVDKPKPSVAASISISNRQCSQFTATVTGQANLFNPNYCLYNAANVQVSCNSTGVFSNVPYGQYTVRIVSSAPCYDTTITRTFTEMAPKPTVAAAPSYTNLTCSDFTATITGQSNLFSPNYCLFLNGIQISCNNTGVFSNLAYGTNYCIRTTSSAPCYDTTIERCFTVAQPVASAATPVIANRTCNDFSVSIPSVTNIPNPKYCLFDNANNPLGCNGSGTFTNLPYGSYYIDIVTTSVVTTCPTSTVRKSFTATRLVPSVAASVSISAKTCTNFTASITGQTNLISPQYCLFDASNNQVACNNTGVFTGVSFGTYKIVVTNSCGEVITRNFTESGIPVAFSLAASESCTINSTNVKVTVSSGQAPFVMKVLNPVNSVVATQSVNTTTYTFLDLPALPGTLQYKVAVTSNCGQSDTVLVTPKPSVFTRARTILSKCPSGLAENGAGNLSIDLTSNIGLYTPMIIKRDGAAVSIAPATITNVSSTAKKYDFFDLTPATYVLEYNISTCSQKVTDTIVVPAYHFPDLKNSAAYQCDNNNFSVSAAASNGVAPFSYEIIGSLSSGASLVMAPQASPVFNINTGQTHSLIRMRAIDACGNGTLNDVSVLPLGKLTISANNVDCYSNNITLTVDTIPNATYTWYKKTSPTDSVLINTSQSYNIPYLLPTDTGVYVCKTLVNGGCLTRISRYRINGDCSMILPVTIISFTGKLDNNEVPLAWKSTEEKGINRYTVQRAGNGSTTFTNVGDVSAANRSGINSYSLVDKQPLAGRSSYRLKIVSEDGKVGYSNIININNDAATVINIGPNPVKNELSVNISSRVESAYEIRVINLNGQSLQQQKTGSISSATISLARPSHMAKGMYLVKVTSLRTGEVVTRKMIYE